MNEYKDSRIIERGTQWNTHVTCNGVEPFTICNAANDHQTACNLAMCNSSMIYWKKIIAWFKNYVFCLHATECDKSSVHKIALDVLGFGKLLSKCVLCLYHEEATKYDLAWTGELAPNKAKMTCSASKIMATVFRDWKYFTFWIPSCECQYHP